MRTTWRDFAVIGSLLGMLISYISFVGAFFIGSEILALISGPLSFVFMFSALKLGD